MRRGQILMVVGVVSMLVGAFGMGASLRASPRPVLQMEPVQVTPVDAGLFETLAKPTPLPKAVTLTAADAGTKAFDPTDRRDEFKLHMNVLAVEIGLTVSDVVAVKKIYFATSFTEKVDAAVVAFKAERLKETTLVVFIFQTNGWKTLPTDFQ